MPGVGPAAFGAIQLEEEAGAFAGRHCGVGDRFAEQVGEGLLGLVVELALVPEEDHLVAYQGGLDRLDGGGVQFAGQGHAANLRADPSGDRLDVEPYRRGEGLCCIAHVMFLMRGVLRG